MANSGQVRLRIFSYHILRITEMRDGETLRLSPVEANLVITVEREGSLYSVNGKSAGNLNGAVRQFAEAVSAVATGLHPDND